MAGKGDRRDMGSGSLYQRADGMWIGYVSLPVGADGKRRRKYISGRTKALAAQRLKDARKDLDRSGDLPTSSPTVAAWARQWLTIRKRDMKPTSWVSYERQVTRYILPVLGRKRLDKLVAADVERLHSYITDDLGLSSTTAASAYNVLKGMLKHAVRTGRVTRNAAEFADPPRRAVSKRGSLTVEQAVALLKSVADDPDAFIRWSLALVLGMRQGECLGLTWEMVNLDRGTIKVAWQQQQLRWEHGCAAVDGGWACGYKRAAWCPRRRVPIPDNHEAEHIVDALWLLRPKSRAGWREFPIPDGLWEALRRYRECDPGGMRGLVLHRTPERAPQLGRPIPAYDDSPAWHAALKVAGVPDVPLHSARHTTASLLRHMKVPEDIRMAILGHGDRSVTAGYTHQLDDREGREAVNGLERLLSA